MREGGSGNTPQGTGRPSIALFSFMGFLHERGDYPLRGCRGSAGVRPGTHNPFRVTCGQGTTATWSPDLGRAGNSLRDQAIWVHRWGEAPLGGHPRSVGSLKVQQKQEKAKQSQPDRGPLRAASLQRPLLTQCKRDVNAKEKRCVHNPGTATLGSLGLRSNKSEVCKLPPTVHIQSVTCFPTVHKPRWF